MDSIYICGGVPLEGTIDIQGSKNAALPILAATLLIEGETILSHCPDIADVDSMLTLLKSLGAIVSKEEDGIRIDASKITGSRLPIEQVMSMRSSVLLMGPMLGRLGEVSLQYPGGCVIGSRPIDMHLKAIEQMQVMLVYREQGFLAYTDQLTGTQVSLKFPSVGVTENLILAATLAKGITIIKNAALEPEITTLCLFLRKAGALIEGIGSGEIAIIGVDKLTPITFEIPRDRIATGTYSLAAMITRGIIKIKHAPLDQLTTFWNMAEAAGTRIQRGEDYIVVDGRQAKNCLPYVKTDVYPGFPTDLQSQFLTFLCGCNGESIVEETIFENRFKVIRELNSMGARIIIHEKRAYIEGGSKLHGKAVIGEELRGGAALVLAGLAAEGITTVRNKHFIDRGYVRLSENLKALGARIDSD